MTDDTVHMLSMLLASCERLQTEAKHGPIVWDNRKPTIFYLERNMKWAREAIAEHPTLDANTGE